MTSGRKHGGEPVALLITDINLRFLMISEWNCTEEVEKNVAEVGFKDAKAVEKDGAWVFENRDEALECFFERATWDLSMNVKAWERRGHSTEKVKEVYENVLVGECGDGKGELKGT